MEAALKFEKKDFPVFRTIQTRWMDVDNYGHVNNVAYLSYFDTAVNGWYIENHILDMAGGAQIFLVVETKCTYLGEIKFPDSVGVGIRVKKIGSSSVCFDLALFRNDENKACAQGSYVHVLVDRKSRKPVAISELQRQLFATARPKENN